jgi:predicted dehydrogenase
MIHKFAIFGTGQMAAIYAEILQQRPDATLAGAVGNTLEKTEQFARKFEVPAYSNSQYERILKDHPDIDTLIIATPEWVRDEPILAALESKRHILLEKPFADSWEAAVRYRGLFDNFQSVFGICHVLRYSPRFFALRETVQSGRIGTVRHIHARRNSNNQRVRRVLGRTDLAFWLAPHDIDMIRWVTGQEIDRVYAVSRTKLSSPDDYLIAHLRLDNGIDAVLEVSWCGPPVSGTAKHAVFEVRGSEGHVELEDFEMNVRVFAADNAVTAPDTYEHYDLHGLKDGYFKNMIDQFIRGLEHPSRLSNSLSDAVEATRVCAMIRKSLDEERVVQRTEFL